MLFLGSLGNGCEFVPKLSPGQLIQIQTHSFRRQESSSMHHRLFATRFDVLVKNAGKLRHFHVFRNYIWILCLGITSKQVRV
jgi:hypothetical protein